MRRKFKFFIHLNRAEWILFFSRFSHRTWGYFRYFSSTYSRLWRCFTTHNHLTSRWIRIKLISLEAYGVLLAHVTCLYYSSMHTHTHLRVFIHKKALLLQIFCYYIEQGTAREFIECEILQGLLVHKKRGLLHCMNDDNLNFRSNTHIVMQHIRQICF